MKKKLVVMCLFLSMIGLAGCTSKNGTSEINNAVNSTEMIERAGELSVNTEKNIAQEKELLIESDTFGRIVYEGERYTWQEISIIIPQEWSGRYLIKENENGVSFYQKASNEKDEALGFLCSIYRSSEYLNSGTGETLAAYTNEGVLYYLIQPTDVTSYMEDEVILAEYVEMMEYVDQIAGSMEIEKENVYYDARQFAIPVSSILLLEDHHLVNLTNNELWIARNEIYARHGRIFKNEYLASYFDACSWYELKEGKTEVSELELNEVEISNLKLIIAAEERYAKEHSYPKQYTVGEAVEVSLYEGKEQSISYHVISGSDWEHQCILTIDGTEYYLNDYVTMAAPVEDVYYITDISYYDEKVEIAVLDNGPSDDPVTYFFQYDGELHYVGEVQGFPFKNYGNSFFDGFSGQNSVMGIRRSDLIESAYVYAYYWYNSNERTLEYMERTSSNYTWFDAHELYVDLPVYYAPDVESPMFTIKAQEKVYFIATDTKEWILVRSSDGIEGYIQVKDGQILNIGRSAEKVFSELYFFD